MHYSITYGSISWHRWEYMPYIVDSGVFIQMIHIIIKLISESVYGMKPSEIWWSENVYCVVKPLFDNVYSPNWETNWLVIDILWCCFFMAYNSDHYQVLNQRYLKTISQHLMPMFDVTYWLHNHQFYPQISHWWGKDQEAEKLSQLFQWSHKIENWRLSAV